MTIPNSPIDSAFRPRPTAQANPAIMPPHKATEAANRAVAKQNDHTPRTPLVAPISDTRSIRTGNEKISLLVTPVEGAIHSNVSRFVDMMVVYNGMQYRITYRLKAGEVLPEKFDEYCIAVIEAGHEEAETEEDRNEKRAKKELLQKPFIAEDNGRNGYRLTSADIARRGKPSSNIQIQLPTHYAPIRDKLETFTLPEYWKQYGQLLPKTTPRPSPFYRNRRPPPLGRTAPLNRKRVTPSVPPSPPTPPMTPPRIPNSPLSPPLTPARVTPPPIPPFPLFPPPMTPSPRAHKTGLETVNEVRADYLSRSPEKEKEINEIFDRLIRLENVGEDPLSLAWIEERVKFYAKPPEIKPGIRAIERLKKEALEKFWDDLNRVYITGLIYDEILNDPECGDRGDQPEWQQEKLRFYTAAVHKRPEIRMLHL